MSSNKDMATCENAYRDTDPLSLSCIIDLQLQDSQELIANAKGKGKQPEGSIDDADLALRMYMEDLERSNAVLSDRRLAQSMTTAVLLDSQLIHHERQREERFARDRLFARSLDESSARAPSRKATDKSMPVQPNSSDHETWTDQEFLDKMASLYMGQSIPAMSPMPDVVYESDSDGTIAESSSWGASRQNQQQKLETHHAQLNLPPQKQGHCVICAEDVPFADVARVPCNHEYCRKCLTQLFELSMSDETLFPPRCDGQEIPLARVRFWLPDELVKRFGDKYAELSTKHRTYCHDSRCNTWIDPAHIDQDSEIGSCPRCTKTTCITCNGPSHTGDCPDDVALRQLVDTANTHQWQRCYQCKRFVELDVGCNHMSCPCGAQFCYTCGQQWRTCNCEQWSENRLMARAAQLIDRENAVPGRQLFEPERVLHVQPASRRQSVNANDTDIHAASAASQTQFPELAVPGAHAWTAANDSFDDWGASVSGVAGDIHRTSAANANRIREMRIAQAAERLRANHECDHNKWRWVRGGHRCEECYHWLPEYIFECRQCQLQACNRCRRNRL